MASIWAVGDIHGRLAQLEALLDALPRQVGDFTVFIGDYIDRGPDSAGVVRRVLGEYDAAPERTILLWGNHEDLAAERFGAEAPSGFEYDPYDWFRNGGIETMDSYGYKERRGVFTADCPPELARLFGLLKTFWRPPANLFPDLVHVIFVHAGVPVSVEPEDAKGEELLWIREEFLNPIEASGRWVVHGHTPFEDVRVLPDKIGIDTGAGYGYKLTALQLPERRIYQANYDNAVTQRDLFSRELPGRVQKYRED